MASPRPPHLAALTGLRFVAALLVVLYHALPALPLDTPVWLRAVLSRGYVGVSLFFLLSGFILAYNYLDSDAPVTPGPFWRARFARVYPVYALSLLPALPFFVRVVQGRTGGTWEAAGQVGGVGVAVVSLTQAWFPAAACEWNCPGWSLSVEAFFYLAFPLLAARVVRVPARRLPAVALAVWGVSLVVPAVFVAAGLDGPADGGPEWRTPARLVAMYNPLVRLPEFVVGVLLGRMWLAGGAEVSRVWTRLAGGAASGALLALAGVLASGGALPFLMLHNSLLLPLFVVLVLGLAAGRDPLARLLSQRPVVLLGEASYALYILHFPLWLAWLAVAVRVGWRALESLTSLGAFVALSVAVSVAVLKGVEEPARRWLRRGGRGLVGPGG